MESDGNKNAYEEGLLTNDYLGQMQASKASLSSDPYPVATDMSAQDPSVLQFSENNDNANKSSSAVNPPISTIHTSESTSKLGHTSSTGGSTDKTKASDLIMDFGSKVINAAGTGVEGLAKEGYLTAQIGKILMYHDFMFSCCYPLENT